MKPRVAVFKLTSCDGCQLQLLSLEDELLALTSAIELVFFAEATSRRDDGGALDIAIVEGSVSTEEQREALLRVRARAKQLWTIGACATAGGIQALRNFADARRYLELVYAEPSYVDTLEAVTPLSELVTVDFELRGCPIDKEQLRELLTAALVGRKPGIADESVCLECKRRGNVCVMVARGEPCLGPVTHTGCGALCPSFARGCFGCFGPRERANTAALAAALRASGESEDALRRLFRLMTACAPAFREEGDRHG